MISNRLLLSASTNLFRRAPVLCQRTQSHAGCQSCVDLLHLFLVDLPDIAPKPPAVNRPYLLQQQQGCRGKARYIVQQNMGRKVGLIPSAGDSCRHHRGAEIVSHIILKNEYGARSALFRTNVADGLFCREIDGLFCRSSPDIIVRRRCVLSHKRRGWLQPSPSFRYSRNLALQDELYHPVINNGPAVLVCVDKRLGTGPVNQSRDAG